MDICTHQWVSNRLFESLTFQKTYSSLNSVYFPASAIAERRVLLPGEVWRKPLQHISLSKVQLVCGTEEERSTQSWTRHPQRTKGDLLPAQACRQHLKQTQPVSVYPYGFINATGVKCELWTVSEYNFTWINNDAIQRSHSPTSSVGVWRRMRVLNLSTRWQHQSD